MFSFKVNTIDTIANHIIGVMTKKAVPTNFGDIIEGLRSIFS